MKFLAFTLACLAAAASTASAQNQAAKPSEAATGQSQAQSPFASARLLLQQGKYDEGLAQLRALAATQPSLKGLSHELGAAYYKKGDYLQAIDALKLAIAEDAADNEAVQLLGLSYYLAGRPAEAIPHLVKVQTWYPNANVDASYMLGMCYLQTHDYDHARGAFARMYDVAPDSAASYLFSARMLLRQQFEPIAEEYALKAVAIDPRLPLAHSLLGELYLFKSRIPEAISEFQKELAINPGNAAIYYKLADAYSRVQKFDEAEHLLQRSIWLDSTSTGPYILMGKVLARKGETELAVRALQHSLSMDPNNFMAHYLLGQAYRDLGNKEDADREFKVAEQLHGQDPAR